MSGLFVRLDRILTRDKSHISDDVLSITIYDDSIKNYGRYDYFYEVDEHWLAADEEDADFLLQHSGKHSFEERLIETVSKLREDTNYNIVVKVANSYNLI